MNPFWIGMALCYKVRISGVSYGFMALEALGDECQLPDVASFQTKFRDLQEKEEQAAMCQL